MRTISAWPPRASRAYLHAGDVDPLAAQDLADDADDARAVGVAEEDQCSAAAISMSKPSTSVSFTICRGPVRVPLTETTWPSGSVPRTVTRLR